MKTGDTNTQNVHPSEMSIPSVHKLKERLIQISVALSVLFKSCIYALSHRIGDRKLVVGIRTV